MKRTRRRILSNTARRRVAEGFQRWFTDVSSFKNADALSMIKIHDRPAYAEIARLSTAHRGTFMSKLLTTAINHGCIERVDNRLYRSTLFNESMLPEPKADTPQPEPKVDKHGDNFSEALRLIKQSQDLLDEAMCLVEYEVNNQSVSKKEYNDHLDLMQEALNGLKGEQ